MHVAGRIFRCAPNPPQTQAYGTIAADRLKSHILFGLINKENELTKTTSHALINHRISFS